jgi:hypothetical protein
LRDRSWDSIKTIIKRHEIKHRIDPDLYSHSRFACRVDQPAARDISEINRVGDLHAGPSCKKEQVRIQAGDIGFFATALWGVSTALKDAGVELLRFAPGLGWAAGVIVAVVFVLLVGLLGNMYFSK